MPVRFHLCSIQFVQLKYVLLLANVSQGQYDSGVNSVVSQMGGLHIGGGGGGGQESVYMYNQPQTSYKPQYYMEQHRKVGALLVGAYAKLQVNAPVNNNQHNAYGQMQGAGDGHSEQQQMYMQKQLSQVICAFLSLF